LSRADISFSSSWALLAEPETWILVLEGHAAVGLAAASIGQTIFVGGDRASLVVGADELKALIAYPASHPIEPLLQKLSEQQTASISPAAAAVPRLTGFAEARP